MTGFKSKREMRSDYQAGWSDAIEAVAQAIEKMNAFPKDTLASFAIYIRNLKVEKQNEIR